MRPLACAFVVWSLAAGPALAQPPNFTSPPTVVAIAGRQVTVSWTTSVPASSDIAWRPADGGVVAFGSYPNIDLLTVNETRHTRTLRRLPPGSWQLKVRSTNGPDSLDSADITVDIPDSEKYPMLNVAFDGRINALVSANNTLYAGGSFTRGWVLTGSGLLLDSTTGARVATQFPEIAGQVNEVIASENDTGFYVCGAFGWVGGVPHAGVARLLASGDLDTTFNVQIDGSVEDCVLSGTTLYVVGNFVRVSGMGRRFAAAIDVNSGTVLPWNPDLSGVAYAVAVAPSAVYVGGEFTSVAFSSTATPRLRLAAFDPMTGVVQAFRADVNAAVRDLALDGPATTLWVGGAFDTVGGTARPRVASVDATTGALLAFNANLVGAEVTSMVYDSGQLFLGGRIDSVGGQQRTNLAQVDAISGAFTPFNPSSNNPVNRIWKRGQVLYVGGSFTSLGGVTRRGAGSVDIPSALGTSFDPDLSGPARGFVILPGSSTVYVGGAFSGAAPSVGASRFARINPVDAGVTLGPSFSGTIFAMAAGTDQLYATGFFTTVGGQARSNVASVLFAGNTVSTFAPAVNQSTHGVGVSNDGRIFIGGDFTAVGAVPRNYVAALLPDASVDSTWDVPANNSVETLTVRGDVVYLGGTFTNVGGSTRQQLAIASVDGGLLPRLSDNAGGGTVYALGPTPNSLYVGGTFGTWSGMSRGNGAAVAQVAMPLTWNPATNAQVTVVEPYADGIFVGGSFSNPANGAAMVERNSGNLISSFGMSGPTVVRAVASDCANGRFAIGGSIFNVGPAVVGGLALLEGNTRCANLLDGGGFVFDAGTPDAGIGVPDAGATSDAGTDAGVLDAGDVDAGAPDAGDVDAGDVDAGDVDAGDVDAGPPDAGGADASVDFDAGQVPSDAGTEGDGGRGRWMLPVGCGCTSSSPEALALLLGVALLRRRRR